jgi:hypothetical protein
MRKLDLLDISKRLIAATDTSATPTLDAAVAPSAEPLGGLGRVSTRMPSTPEPVRGATRRGMEHAARNRAPVPANRALRPRRRS